MRTNAQAMPLTTTAAEGLPRRRFTVAELERMAAAGILDEDERIELIGGEIVPMSPKGNQHEVVKIALTIHWARRLQRWPRLSEQIFRVDKWNLCRG
jgi:Uma2 family endonuclease